MLCFRSALAGVLKFEWDGDPASQFRVSPSVLHTSVLELGSVKTKWGSALSIPPLRELRVRPPHLLSRKYHLTFADWNTLRYLGVHTFFSTRRAKLGECKWSRATIG